VRKLIVQSIFKDALVVAKWILDRSNTSFIFLGRNVQTLGINDSQVALWLGQVRKESPLYTAFCKNTGHGANAANKNMVTPPKLGGNPIP